MVAILACSSRSRVSCELKEAHGQEAKERLGVG